MANVTMSWEKEIIIVAACTAAIAASLGATCLLAIGRKQSSTWLKKYIHGREQYEECRPNTLLPELAATDVAYYLSK